MDKQKQIEEIARIIAFDLCPNRYGHAKWGEEAQCYSDNNFAECTKIKNVVDKLYNAGYRKIPEGAVVLTDDELNEVLDTCKVSIIVTDDNGEKYISLDDHNEYTQRLGKISRQRKARIEYLEKLLDDRCDRCIERERKETAEKFAERLKEEMENASLFEGFELKQLEIDGELLEEAIDKICKEFTGDKDEKG